MLDKISQLKLEDEADNVLKNEDKNTQRQNINVVSGCIWIHRGKCVS